MTTFVALLGAGKGTWVEVHNILKSGSFEKAILFIDDWAAKNYRNEYGAITVPLPEDATQQQLIDIMGQHLRAGIDHDDLDVAINIASGTGKQHAALITSLLTLGFGIRLVSYENDAVKVLT